MLTQPWRFELFGKFHARQGDCLITRFQTHKTGVLLAHLVYFPYRTHSRESLTEQLWPETEAKTGRDRLKQALASLRRQLEPPPITSGSVLIADRSLIQLNPAAIVSDVADFERVLDTGGKHDEPSRSMKALLEAVSIYAGDLLPGYYEDWILLERRRLAERYVNALRRLSVLHAGQGDTDAALDFTLRAVAIDPLLEEAHADAIRLYLASHQPGMALRQYQELEQILKEQFQETPSETTRALMQDLRVRAPAPVSRAKIPAARSSVPQYEVLPVAPGPALSPLSAGLPVLPAPRLPLHFAPFFGRESEVQRLHALLLHALDPHPTALVPATDGAFVPFEPPNKIENPVRPCEDQPARAYPCRLVTLTGPGGVGKTRLACETAQRLASHGHNACWFVSLAERVETRFIMDAVLEALGQSRSPHDDPLQQICSVLSPHPCLLILDNFEQLLPAGTDVVRLLLDRIPRLVCLLTSRQTLNLEGEREFSVAPLPVPGAERLREQETRGPEECEAQAIGPSGEISPPALSISMSLLLECPSLQLLVDRAQAVRPDFQITPRNAETLALLCQRLEGLPLALELAAVWFRSLTAAQILEQLEHRFNLPVSRRRDLPPRHRSLRAVIESSYRRLPATLQRFFARLSIFRGGWTAEAAEAVCEEAEKKKDEKENGNEAAEHSARLSSLECLAQLQEHSLIVGSDLGGRMRYRMLDSLREYAWEQLNDAQRVEVARRHTACFLALANEADSHYPRADGAFWLDKVESEVDNFRAALDWALNGGDADMGVQLLFALSFFWQARGYLHDSHAYLEQASRRTEEVSDPLRIRLLLATTSLNTGRVVAVQRYEECLAWYRRQEDLSGQATVYNRLAGLAFDAGDFPRAQMLLEQTLEIYRQTNEELPILWTQATLAEAHRLQGNLVITTRLLEQCLSLARKLDDVGSVAKLQLGQGIVAIQQGEFHTACTLVKQSLATFDTRGEKWNRAHCLYNLGLIAALQGAQVQAQEHLTLSMQLFTEMEDPVRLSHVGQGLALAARNAGHLEQARDFSRQALEQARLADEPHEIARALCSLAESVLALGNHVQASALYGESLHLFRTLQMGVETAWCLCGMGKSHLAQRHFLLAQECFDQSLALAHRLWLQPYLIQALEGLANAFAEQQRFEPAVRLMGATEAARRALTLCLAPFEQSSRAILWELLCAQLGEHAALTLFAEGRALTLAQAVHVAFALLSDLSADTQHVA